MPKNNRFIINKEILPKTKRESINWNEVKEIEVYFTDTEENYILKVEDIIKDKNKIRKILLSYDGIKYKSYLQTGHILNGNLEALFNYFGIRGNKVRPFKLSDDGSYWIGITDKGEEFYFNGKNSEEIMKHNWYVSNGCIVTKFQNGSLQIGTRLNRFVLSITDRNVVVNHCGGNKMDNRVEKLSISDHEDNAKEHKPSIYNNTGVTGLTYDERYKKYRIRCNINGFSYTCIYKAKEEALKDLLIIQRNYGYRHNENLYYILDDISEEYINKLIDKVETVIELKNIRPIICKNRFELSEDGSFYYMYDKDDNKCKISIEDLDLVKQGNWHHTLNNGKDYFSGGIIVNGKRKNIFLHRFLFNLIDTKYRIWYIDHLDRDGLNNTRENMVITDAKGNGLNKPRTYIMKNLNNAYENAMERRYKKLDEMIKNRLEFKSKEELDKYILDNKL